MTERFIAVLSKWCSNVEHVYSDLTLTDLGFDSLDVAGFACDLEDEYGITLTWKMIWLGESRSKTLEELCSLCETKFQEKI